MALDILNTPTRLKISDIRTDGGTQPRAGLTSQIIAEYADAISGPNDWPFPPLVVFHDGSAYWLADGFHRLAAAKWYADRERILYSIVADVRQGTQRDAVLYSVGANADHGLRRTSEDKRRAVLRLLEDAEWSQWSNREIARRCRVDEKTVRSLRDTVSAENPQIERKVERNGTVYTQNTANIGATKPEDKFATVDDLTRHIGSWLSQQIGTPAESLTNAARRDTVTRRHLENFLNRREVKFAVRTLEDAIAEVMTNVVSTGAADTELRGPMPTMSHKDVADLKKAQAQSQVPGPQSPASTDNTSLSVDAPTIERTASGLPRMNMVEHAIANEAANRPLNGRTGDDLIKQHEADGWKVNRSDDGWKVNRSDDGWQAIHHHDQVATPVFGNVAELLDAIDDGNFAEEWYFLDDGVEALSTIVSRFRHNLDMASHYLGLAEEGMAQIRTRHDASAVDMGLRTTRKWLDQTIGGGEVIAKFTANK